MSFLLRLKHQSDQEAFLLFQYPGEEGSTAMMGPLAGLLSAGGGQQGDAIGQAWQHLAVNATVFSTCHTKSLTILLPTVRPLS